MILVCAAALFLLVAIANALFWQEVTADPGELADVSILIPARDEERNLPRCLENTIATSAAEILVYDDHSTDRTASIVREFRRRDLRVRLIGPRDLPDGWAGKTFACQTLASEARGVWLLFLDADALVSPAAPQRIAAEAAHRSLTFLSCWPAFDMRSLAERVLMPMLNFVVFSLFPGPLSARRDMPGLGLAHGACILAHRETYRRLGGHSLVRGELFEDTRLAQVWRKAGERGLCLDGRRLVSVRMYEDFGGIWRGFQKNFYPAFRHPAGFFAFLILHFTVFLLPFLTGQWLAAAIVLAARLVLAIRFRHPWLSVLLHPVGEAVLIAIGIVSCWRCVTRRGVSWKGRVYRAT